MSFGAVSQIRTGDLILTKDALYLLSYNSVPCSLSIIYNNFQNVNSFFEKNQIFFIPTFYPEKQASCANFYTKVRTIGYT